MSLSPAAGGIDAVRRTGSSFDSFSILAVFWAFAILTHQAFGALATPSVRVVLTIAMVGVLLRPSSVPRFLVMVACQIFAFIHELPYSTNHWVMLGIGSVWILMAAGILVVRERRLPAGIELYRLATPALRIMVVVVYFFATLHKINWDFLNPALSCAPSMYGTIRANLLFLPAGLWVDQAAIYGTLAIEASLPGFLLWPRSRPWALVFGTIFHVALGIAGYYNFSGTMLAFYALFLGEDFPATLRSLVRERPRLSARLERVRHIARHPLAWPVGAVAALALSVLPAWAGLPLWQIRWACRVTVLVLWLTVTMAVLRVFLATWHRMGGKVCRGVRSGLGHRWAWVPLAILLLVGFSPFLGLRTEASFAMFSNLQTEEDQWNHLFMPKQMRVFEFQSDLVTIVASSDPVLQADADTGTRSVYFMFWEYASRRPDLSVTYRRGDAERTVTRAGDDPELSRPPNRVLAKLLWFRPVAPREANTCRH